MGVQMVISSLAPFPSRGGLPCSAAQHPTCFYHYQSLCTQEARPHLHPGATTPLVPGASKSVGSCGEKGGCIPRGALGGGWGTVSPPPLTPTPGQLPLALVKVARPLGNRVQGLPPPVLRKQARERRAGQRLQAVSRSVHSGPKTATEGLGVLPGVPGSFAGWGSGRGAQPHAACYPITLGPKPNTGSLWLVT